MKSKKNSSIKRKTKRNSPPRVNQAVSFEDAENLLDQALKASPKDIKVSISLRLDGDIYLSLKRHAEQGAGNSKYQVFLNQILRNYLFGESIEEFGEKKLINRQNRKFAV